MGDDWPDDLDMDWDGIFDQFYSAFEPETPSADELDTSRRREAQIGGINRLLDAIADMESPAGEQLPALEDIPGPDFDAVAYDYLRQTTNDESMRGASPAIDLVLDQRRDLDDKEWRRWALVLIARARDSSVRATVRRLEDHPDLADRMGFDDGVPHHSTISRSVDLDDTEEVLQPFLKRMRHAALRMGATIPDSLAEEYGLINWVDADVTMDEKMDTAESLLASLLTGVLPHIGFDRDPDAPNYNYPPESFYALLAHLALEQSFAETGARTLQWMGAQSTVPEAKTLFRYIREYTVEEIDEKFAAATATLLDNADLPSPLHLAYDVTNVRWYGDSSVHWANGTLPKDNTSYAWQFAVLSAVHPDHMYILGALPLRSESNLDAILRLFLRRAIDRFDVSVGRVYMDSQLARAGVIETIRSVNADYLIQAPDDGKVSNLLDAAPAGEPEPKPNIPFSDFSGPDRPNAFAYPIPPAEVGGTNQKRDHTAFLTDLDVEERDLQGLAYQFRSRWRIETSIRELKNRFHARTRSDDGEIRAWFFLTAALFYNLHSRINGMLPAWLGVPPGEVHLTGEEFLHILREGEFVGGLHE